VREIVICFAGRKIGINQIAFVVCLPLLVLLEEDHMVSLKQIHCTLNQSLHTRI